MLWCYCLKMMYWLTGDRYRAALPGSGASEESLSDGSVPGSVPLQSNQPLLVQSSHCCRLSQWNHRPLRTTRTQVSSKSTTPPPHQLHLSFHSTLILIWQHIQAHSSEVTACSFSPDGKNLATYCVAENRLSFWQVNNGEKWKRTRLINE